MSRENVIVKLKNLIDCEIFEARENYVGQVLTIIDATISDSEQRKGLKDLVRNELHSKENTHWRLRRIGRMLWEFNSKFAKVPLTPSEDKYLRTGEWDVEEIESPPPQSYFPEN
jgi:hypothetical protein